jgi:Zn-dependent oligopeptidase
LKLYEVETIFHEFGHALHGLLSRCRYSSLGGTNVYWDFVELPSQIMENWVHEKDALDLFAYHYETGEKLSDALIEKVKAAKKFQAGMFTLRQLGFGFLDLSWHYQGHEAGEGVVETEEKVMQRIRLYPRVPKKNSSCQFSHIFAGGYSAGYYSYKWAELLEADAFEYFKEKGIFNPEVAGAFMHNILERGNSEHPMKLYVAFRGKEPDPEALLRKSGLIGE